jgi:hypothetical protein
MLRRPRPGFVKQALLHPCLSTDRCPTVPLRSASRLGQAVALSRNLQSSNICMATPLTLVLLGDMMLGRYERVCGYV